MTLLTDQASWRQLEAHYANPSSRELIRDKTHCLSAVGITLDYSRKHLDSVALSLFSALADDCALSDAISRLFAGQIVNISEQRAAWHTVLRDPEQQPESVQHCFKRMRAFADAFDPQVTTDIIHIGIGGSYLGPRFVYDIFANQMTPRARCHFIANQNVDSIAKLLDELDLQKTQVIVVSKSFTTLETMKSAGQVMNRFKEKLGDTWCNHFLAVTANEACAKAAGFLEDAIFPMWSWLGGRFSLWSAVSLALVAAFGWNAFQSLLKGAHAMDEHFQTTPWSQNIPAIQAFIGLVYRHFFSAQTQAIIPYHHALGRLPAHLQQLHMESLGKQVSQHGEPLNYPTGAILWGGTGPGSQHSFHQLLLQGYDSVPVDFIAVREDTMAFENCEAQADILSHGNETEQLPSYQRLSGNRPSTIISMDRMTPEAVGALLSLYEHKVFTQGVLWDIDPFDQWGVEAGKLLAKKLQKKVMCK